MRNLWSSKFNIFPKKIWFAGCSLILAYLILLKTSLRFFICSSKLALKIMMSSRYRRQSSRYKSSYTESILYECCWTLLELERHSYVFVLAILHCKCCFNKGNNAYFCFWWNPDNVAKYWQQPNLFRMSLMFVIEYLSFIIFFVCFTIIYDNSPFHLDFSVKSREDCSNGFGLVL